MASISSPGIGSGLDVNTIVSQLMKIEQRPLRLLQTKASGIETKISSFGQIKSAMSALYDAAKSLADLDSWRGKLMSSSDESILKGSATGAATAAQFSVQVNGLAQAQAVASGSVASGASIGTSGTLSIQRGSWSEDSSSFTEAGASVNIAIDANDSLATIAGKINKADAGIAAVVVKGVTGDQLLLRSSKTGEENGFALSVSDPGLSKLAYDPASVAANDGATRTQAAQDALFTINGIASKSASNTVTDVVPGLTLNLVKTSPTPVDVSITEDTKAIKTKIEAFVQAYNKVNSVVADLTRYNQATSTSQPLQGDSTAVALQTSLRRIIGTPNAEGAYLSDLGLQLQRDGSLSMNTTKIDEALTDLPKLQKLLTDGTNGFVTQVRDFAFKANGVDGSITSRNNALQASLKSNHSDQDRMSLLLEQRQKSLLKQYQSLDASMGSMGSLGSFVSQWSNSLKS